MQAEPEQHAHAVTVLLDVNAKQVGQLYRDWRAVVDVVDVRAGALIADWDHATFNTPHPPTSVGGDNAAQSGAGMKFSSLYFVVVKPTASVVGFVFWDGFRLAKCFNHERHEVARRNVKALATGARGTRRSVILPRRYCSLTY